MLSPTAINLLTRQTCKYVKRVFGMGIYLQKGPSVSRVHGYCVRLPQSGGAAHDDNAQKKWLNFK
jgi:hypothetical protein